MDNLERHMTSHRSILLCLGMTACGIAGAAERTIAVPPMLQESWEFVTPGTTARMRPHLGVGFWQRGSGAKPGVGSNYVSALEYQLPEAAPARVRSASFQFSGSPAQCVGTEPVVIEVNAYAANGKAEVADASAGSRVAQLSADCTDKAAFARPIDVTAIVRQLSVASGVRFVGFNIRKANNRQGPGIFNLSAGKLTIVLADTAVAAPTAPMVRAPAAMPAAPAVAMAPTRAPVPLPAAMRAAPTPTPTPHAHSASAAPAALQKARTVAER
jgi:hypothetical protein